MSNRIACKKCFKNVRAISFYGKCQKCDTTSAGTWCLSYLASLGYINNDDDIRMGYVHGTSGRKFMGLPNKTEIFCEVDEEDREVYHLKHKIESEEYEDEDSWWNYDNVGRITFRAKVKLTII